MRTWAIGLAFDEFNGYASRVELYEASAEAEDSIEDVKAGRAKLLGVQDPNEETRERLRVIARTEALIASLGEAEALRRARARRLAGS